MKMGMRIIMGFAVLLGAMGVRADVHQRADHTTFLREVDRTVDGLRKETDELRVRQRSIEGKLGQLEGMRNELMRGLWERRVERRFRQDLERANRGGVTAASTQSGPYREPARDEKRKR